MANTHKVHSEFPEIYTEHMRTLQECMSICAACSKKCIEEGHKKTAALCMECADVCTLAIRAASGHFLFEGEIMELCAHVCKKCADECKKMQVKHCQECAAVCKRCAESCIAARSMA